MNDNGGASLNLMRNHFGHHAVSKEEDKVQYSIYTRILKILAYLIQSMMGQTDRHKSQPVQSSVTSGKCVLESKLIA